MTSDPIRLLDDPAAGAGMRGDLLQATQVELQGLDLAGGLAKLQAATSTSATASGTGLSSTTLTGIGVALVAGSVALWLGLRGPQPPAPEPDRVAAATPGSTAPAQVDPNAEAQREPAEPVDAPATAVDEPVEAPANANAVDEPVEGPAAVDEPATADPAIEADPEPKPAAAVESPRRRARAPKASRPASEESAVAPEFDDSVLREARMVAKARSSLTTDPQRALSLVEQAEKEFPYGQLVEERRAIAIRALVALDRRDEAKRKADAFLAKYSRGAHAAAVRRAIGED